MLCCLLCTSPARRGEAASWLISISKNQREVVGGGGGGGATVAEGFPKTEHGEKG